jgi:hypothetical protein
MYCVRWDHQATVSANGGVVYFVQILESTKALEEWVAECPLTYESSGTHDLRDILGILMASGVNAHCVQGGRKHSERSAIPARRADSLMRYRWMPPSLAVLCPRGFYFAAASAGSADKAWTLMSWNHFTPGGQ